MSATKELKFETFDDWLSGRRGLITGSRVKSLSSNPRSQTFNEETWALIAERMTDEDARDGIEWRNDMERGHYLEDEAMRAIAQQLNVPIIRMNTIIWIKGNIGISPDGSNQDKTVLYETKCLASKNHLKYILGNKFAEKPAQNVVHEKTGIPLEYVDQVVHAFIANDKLEKHVFGLYDPRFRDEKLRLKVITTTREDWADEIAKNNDIIEKTETNLKTIEEAINEL